MIASVFVVTLDSYDDREVLGAASTIPAAKAIAQRHCDARLAGSPHPVPRLRWDPDGDEIGGCMYGRDFSCSYTVKRVDVES